MSNNEKENKRWQQRFAFFKNLAEFCNIGIVFEIVKQLIPVHDFKFIHVITATDLFTHTAMIASSLLTLTDSFLYFFRALSRLVRVAGRYKQAVFEEEKDGRHSWQTTADIILIGVFLFASLAFYGFIIPPPFNITVAWSAGLFGTSIVGYFDYIYPEQLHREKLSRKRGLFGDSSEEKRISRKLKNEKNLYIALIFGLSLLLICSSLQMFISSIVLGVIAKIGSVWLITINLGRLTNFLIHEFLSLKPTDQESIPDVTPIQEKQDFFSSTSKISSNLFPPVVYVEEGEDIITLDNSNTCILKISLSPSHSSSVPSPDDTDEANQDYLSYSQR